MADKKDRSAYLKAYYSRPEVKERRREYLRQWQSRNREKMREYRREWEARNPELARATKRKWQHEHWANDPDYRARELLRRRRVSVAARQRYKEQHGGLIPFDLKSRYGLSVEDYLAAYKAQEGRCAICKIWVARLAVDHDHLTSKVRKLLCSRCNGGIGMLRDDPRLLRAAAEYVESHQTYSLAELMEA